MDRIGRARAVLVVFAGLTALGLAGCSRSTAGAAAPVAPAPVATIAASVDHSGAECRLFVDGAVSAAGPVNLAVSNLTDAASGSASVAFAVVASDGQTTGLGTVGAADRATRTVTLAAGEYRARCVIDGAPVDSDATLIVR